MTAVRNWLGPLLVALVGAVTVDVYCAMGVGFAEPHFVHSVFQALGWA